MKKNEVFRAYNFSDGKLITLTNEKIAFMRRDAAQFLDFGVTTIMVNQLETEVMQFSDTATDIELVSDQTDVTSNKDAIAANLADAIRDVMSRVVLVYPEHSPKYKKFGTETLSRQSDAQLMIVAARVFRVGTEMLSELAANGLTAAMLDSVKSLKQDLEHELVNMHLKIADRDIEQENRVEAGNAIYATLVKYTNTGQKIWASSNVAKYNDYVIYNTSSGSQTDNPSTPTS